MNLGRFRSLGWRYILGLWILSSCTPLQSPPPGDFLEDALRLGEELGVEFQFAEGGGGCETHYLAYTRGGADLIAQGWHSSEDEVISMVIKEGETWFWRSGEDFGESIVSSGGWLVYSQGFCREEAIRSFSDPLSVAIWRDENRFSVNARLVNLNGLEIHIGDGTIDVQGRHSVALAATITNVGSSNVDQANWGLACDQKLLPNEPLLPSYSLDQTFLVAPGETRRGILEFSRLACDEPTMIVTVDGVEGQIPFDIPPDPNRPGASLQED